MTVVFVFILGLFIGSFLNVVIYRLHRAESFIKGFSKCLFCGHRLYAKDLVPIFSFLFLRGRCRYCRRSISWQYFSVELVTGLSFALIFWHIFGLWDLNIWWNNITLILGAQLLIWWIFVAFLIIIFVYDLRYYLILDKVSLPAIVLVFIANLFLGHSWLTLLIAALIGGGFFLAQFVLSQGKWIGGGDIRLGFLMGMILGWPHILTGLFLAYIFGSVIGLCLIAMSKKKFSSKVPFGTFLTLATFIALLYGDVLLNWYLTLWR